MRPAIDVATSSGCRAEAGVKEEASGRAHLSLRLPAVSVVGVEGAVLLYRDPLLVVERRPVFGLNRS